MNTSSQRYTALLKWIAERPELTGASLSPASADASFRRYFRLQLADGSTRIVMDAPPEHEDCGPFVSISNLMHQIGLNVPVCGDFDEAQGFLLLSDLGSETYLQRLQAEPETAKQLYPQALSALATLQAKGSSIAKVPSYNAALLQQEMGLFRDWLLAEHLGLHLPKDALAVLQQQFDLLEASALSQPKVLVHRDYHSRNLMTSESGQPGILDFQDAVLGPITYDAVSLLRDCYISWPDRQIYSWLRSYFELLRERDLVSVDFEKFARWFDWMGVQRHLKASGIFCRLLHRDGKDGYIQDIPLTLNYILKVTDRYRELSPLHDIVLEYCAQPFGLDVDD
jgi:aminoglycoside/choline kinase family phosphotransferase